MNPEDDPNNQGEDEFDEAEDARLPHRAAEADENAAEEEEEPAAPAQHIQMHQNLKPTVEEELVVSQGRRQCIQHLHTQLLTLQQHYGLNRKMIRGFENANNGRGGACWQLQTKFVHTHTYRAQNGILKQAMKVWELEMHYTV